MKVFLTGASGYIGGSIATGLLEQGHQVIGLCRSLEKADLLKQRGIEPIIGSLRDEQVLFETAQASDAVINAADADNPFVVEVLLQALAGSHKKLIHTSGSSIVGDRAGGKFGEHIFDEDSPRPIRFEKIGRVAIDNHVLESANRGVHSIVICPCLIYGYGRGLHTDSIQIPLMIEAARKFQTAKFIGDGENIWSTVHIDDLVSGYLLALEKAPRGSFFFLENGESSFKEIATTINEVFGFTNQALTWTVESAVQEWGQEAAHFAFGSNSRIRSGKARNLLGWNPLHSSVINWLRSVES